MESCRERRRSRLVVIASHTSDVSGSAPPFTFWTSSDAGRMTLPPARQRTRRLLDRYCLSAGEIEAGTLLQELAQILIVQRRHERSPENTRTSFRCDLIERQHRGTDPGVGRSTGHAPTTLVASSWHHACRPPRRCPCHHACHRSHAGQINDMMLPCQMSIGT